MTNATTNATTSTTTNAMLHSVTTHRGRLDIRPVRPLADAPLLQRWLTDEHAAFWDNQDATDTSVREQYAQMADSAHEQAWIIERAGTPVALVETYDPARVVLAGVIPHAAGDLGMHILIAPPPADAGQRESGLSDAIFAATMAWLFHTRGAQRVVVEPDVRNAKVHTKNARAGFVDLPGLSDHRLGDKRARIQHCDPAAFASSPLGMLATVITPEEPGEHLHGPAAERANRELVAKMLREFIHERLLSPTQVGPAQYRVGLGGYVFSFLAHSHRLEHLSIDPQSLTLMEPASGAGLPGITEIVAAAAPELGIPPEFTHIYLEEVAATLAGRARVLASRRPTAAELAQVLTAEVNTPQQQAHALQLCESAMFEGHPGFVANAGRGGMSEVDNRAFAPELGASTTLVWVAARRSQLTTAAGTGIELGEFVDEQVGWDWRGIVKRHGADPADYLPLPVHPWQWGARIATNFADNLRAGDLIYLGRGGDLMHPQQSLRTFFNLSRPARPYAKTAAAVRNMGFMRGLSPKYMSTTPAINDWLEGQLGTDPDFQRHNVRLLKEVAAVGFTGDVFHASARSGAASGTEHTKMLAGLWRESPIAGLRAGSAAVTLAAVLHVDACGRPLVSELIFRSGRSARQWVRALCDVYLRPAIRALAGYDLVFMPHSENVILELRDGFPVGSWFKDLGEEVAVVNTARKVPQEFARIQADDGSFDDETRALSIHTDILDGVLRHLAALLDDHGVLAEECFWHTARQCVEDYLVDYPSDLPLLAPDFSHSCLNRLQLRNPQMMVNLGDQNSSLQFAGRIANPLVQ